MIVLPSGIDKLLFTLPSSLEKSSETEQKQWSALLAQIVMVMSDSSSVPHDLQPLMKKCSDLGLTSVNVAISEDLGNAELLKLQRGLIKAFRDVGLCISEPEESAGSMSAPMKSDKDDRKEAEDLHSSPVAKAKKKDDVEEKTAENQSDASSSSDDDEDEQEKTSVVQAKQDSDDSGSSSSEDEEEEVAAKPSAAATETVSSDSSSSDEDEEEAHKKVAAESDSSSSDSDNDEDKNPPKAKQKFPPPPTKPTDGDSDSSSSDSDSDDEPQKEEKKEPEIVAKPITRPKKKNQPFRRVRPSGRSLESNSWDPSKHGGHGAEAHEKLGRHQGKEFIKAKNKRKRSNRSGHGAIDFAVRSTDLTKRRKLG